MANGRFGSEHAALVALGNALLLGYIIVQGLRADGVRRDKKEGGPGWGRPDILEKERLDYSERTNLRDALSWAGAWDPRVEGSAGTEELSFWETPLEPMDAMFRRAQSLLRSEADIAMLRLQDFAEGDVSLFPHWFLEWPGVRDALYGASLFELGRPLARLGPTPVTRALLPPLLAYFNGHVRDIRHPGAAWFVQEAADTQTPERPASDGVATEARGGGPRPRKVVALQKCAAAALKAMAAANPGARMFRDDFRAAVVKFMSKVAGGERFSMAAATRAWREAAPGEWKVAGAPGNEGGSLTGDDLLPHLRKALEGQGPIPEPPAGLAWEGLLKPGPWTGDT